MDDLEIDPAIAAAMGFSSFGSKRRKHDHRDDDAFVDNSSSSSSIGGGSKIAASTGANNTALGTRSTASGTVEQGVQEQVAADTELATTSGPAEDMETSNAAADESSRGDNWTPGFPAPQELSALRRGIRNTNGDMVVFLPSFVEDPWKGLG